MRRKFFLFNRSSKSVGSDQVDLSSRHEERLNTALASLRRRAEYRQNPLKLDQVMDHVCYAAEVYRRWQESGAYIRDIVLRLSDGNEIKVNKATLKNTNSFGFKFRSKFPRGSVINVYKQADKEFNEDVLLYSIDLDSIDDGGHCYDKTYENGQKMMLKVERGLSGQFNVSVEYTTQSESVNLTPTRRGHLFKLRPGPIELVGVCLLAVLVGLAIQKSATVHDGHTGEAALGATAEVNPLMMNPAAPSQTPADDQARQNTPSGFNVKDAGGGFRPPDATTTTFAHHKAPGVAGGARASARKLNDIKQLQGQAPRLTEAPRGDLETSDSNEAGSFKVTRFEVISRPAGHSGGVVWGVVGQPIGTPVANPMRGTPAGREGKSLRLKRHSRGTDLQAAPGEGAKPSADGSS